MGGKSRSREACVAYHLRGGQNPVGSVCTCSLWFSSSLFLLTEAACTHCEGNPVRERHWRGDALEGAPSA